MTCIVFIELSLSCLVVLRPGVRALESVAGNCPGINIWQLDRKSAKNFSKNFREAWRGGAVRGALSRARTHTRTRVIKKTINQVLSFFLFNSFASFLFSLSFENYISDIYPLYIFESTETLARINRKNVEGNRLSATLRYIENERRNYCPLISSLPF